MPRLFLNPDASRCLEPLGLRTFADFFGLDQGEVISGHRTRNVARVQLGSVRGFLKREYHTPLKDYFESWWAGFGFVSKSVREARALQSLQSSGIHCPTPLAAGEEQGQAFLLVEELNGYLDLPTFLQQRMDTDSDRDRLAHLIGRAVCKLHCAGFTHPDLYVKHLFIDRLAEQVAFIDLQRTRQVERVGWHRRWRDLAALDASLSELLVSRRERLLCLRTYLRSALQVEQASGRPVPPWRVLLREALAGIARRSRHLLRRRKVRRMRGLDTSVEKPLIVEYWRLAVRDELRAEQPPTQEPQPSSRRWRS